MTHPPHQAPAAEGLAVDPTDAHTEGIHRVAASIGACLSVGAAGFAAHHGHGASAIAALSAGLAMAIPSGHVRTPAMAAAKIMLGVAHLLAVQRGGISGLAPVLAGAAVALTAHGRNRWIGVISATLAGADLVPAVPGVVAAAAGLTTTWGAVAAPAPIAAAILALLLPVVPASAGTAVACLALAVLVALSTLGADHLRGALRGTALLLTTLVIAASALGDARAGRTLHAGAAPALVLAMALIGAIHARTGTTRLSKLRGIASSGGARLVGWLAVAWGGALAVPASATHLGIEHVVAALGRDLGVWASALALASLGLTALGALRAGLQLAGPSPRDPTDRRWIDDLNPAETRIAAAGGALCCAAAAWAWLAT